jgi:hypothetical protein
LWDGTRPQPSPREGHELPRAPRTDPGERNYRPGLLCVKSSVSELQEQAHECAEPHDLDISGA